MATKTTTSPAASQVEEITQIERQREDLAARREEIEARLQRLPTVEGAVRAKALAAGKPSWDALGPLREERDHLEAELANIGEDDFSLGLKVDALKSEVRELEAGVLSKKAARVALKQRERLAALTPLIEQIVASYDGLAAGEQELADIRAEIKAVLGDDKTWEASRLSPPVATPFPTSPAALLHEIAWLAGSIQARGSKYSRRSQFEHVGPTAASDWLAVVPDLREDEKVPPTLIDGTTGHVIPTEWVDHW